jgi:hypothetical protein
MLLKGINKRVIVIKNPESEIFEEAYFIIRSGGAKGAFKQSKSNDNEMVLEANRIISDYHNQQKSIIEKNGVASSIGGDLSELDNFLNNSVKNDTVNKIKNINSISNAGKPQKNKKDNKTGKANRADKSEKLNETKKTEINAVSSENPNLNSNDETFDDDIFFENMHGGTEKYNNFSNLYYDPESAYYKKENDPNKSAFQFLSSKKIKKPKKERMKNIPVPSKSFFVGVGFMSAVIILIRLVEMIVVG